MEILIYFLTRILLEQLINRSLVVDFCLKHYFFFNTFVPKVSSIQRIHEHDMKKSLFAQYFDSYWNFNGPKAMLI